MYRFFAEPENLEDKIITLSLEDSEHIKALRIRPNEMFIVCDGKGTDYICHLGDSDRENIPGQPSVAKVLKRQKSRTEPTIKCTVYLAYTKGDRLDYAVQKSTELGAGEIVLFRSGRCNNVPKDIPKKIERLQRIALEAAMQCDRSIVPKVSALDSFNCVIDTSTKRSELVIMCYEEEKNLRMMTVLEHYFPSMMSVIREPKEKIKTVALIIGPEGGFEPAEAELAQARDVSVISLGIRILRSETAPVVALSAIMYHTGNL